MRYLIPCCLRNSAAAVLAAVTLGACKPQAHTAVEFFPLHGGARWDYRVTETTTRWQNEDSLTLQSLGARRYRNDDFHVRVNQHGTEYYLGVDERGVFRVGKRTLTEPDVTFDASPRFVLKYPLDVGQRWLADSHPYVIERMQPFREEFSRTISFQMIYTVESTTETVTVPAGEFRNCVKVSGEGKAVLLAELAKARYGAHEAEIDTIEWYAPGVGLVKLERLESFPNRLFVDGKLTMELTSYEN